MSKNKFQIGQSVVYQEPNAEEPEILVITDFTEKKEKCKRDCKNTNNERIWKN